jgi:hypothetical protein
MRVNRLGRLGPLVLVLVSGGLLALLALGLAVRSCTNAFRSPDRSPEQGEPNPSSPDKNVEIRPARTSETLARAARAAAGHQAPALPPPQLERTLAVQPDLAQALDAGAPNDPSDLTEEETRAIEAKRRMAGKDKLKLLQGRR